jgi:hypothetical protein
MKALRIAAIGGLLMFGTTARGSEIHEGRWTYTMTMDMPNMPAMPDLSKIDPAKLPPGLKMPQRTANGMQMNFDRCITNADLVPQKDGDGHCKITKMDRQGSTVNWASICDSPHGKMNATGVATYSGETMTSTTHMTGTDDRGKPIDITQKITGQYAGACAK